MKDQRARPVGESFTRTKRKSVRSSYGFNTVAVRPREAERVTSRSVPAAPEWMMKRAKPPQAVKR